MLDEALGLWRGPALAGGVDADDGALLAEATRLDELRLVAGEEQIDAMLAIGEPASSHRRGRCLVGQHPLRERIWRQLMLALFRRGGIRLMLSPPISASGRSSPTSSRWIPSPELARLHERILKQDPGLELQDQPALRGYRLLEKIDDEPTGVVWRAIQGPVWAATSRSRSSTSRWLRTLRSCGDSEQEAQAAAALEHPHIVPVYDYWREPGRAYIVSRYLKEESKAALENRGDRLAQGSGSLVVEQVASALGYAHRRPLAAPGRVCASNVFNDGDGTPTSGTSRSASNDFRGSSSMTSASSPPSREA